MSFIYKITNTLNNKSYIGKTSLEDPLKRWKEHLKESKRQSKNKRPLYSAINKYGEESFTFEVLEKTDQDCEREIFYIALYDTYSNGYNATLGGDGKSYIDYEEVVLYYNTYKPTLKDLSSHFKIDQKTIRKILNLKNIVHTPDMTFLNKPVIQKTLEGIFIAQYESTHAAARALGNEKYNSNISRCCRNLRKTANGFIWEYGLQ